MAFTEKLIESDSYDTVRTGLSRSSHYEYEVFYLESADDPEINDTHRLEWFLGGKGNAGVKHYVNLDDLKNGVWFCKQRIKWAREADAKRASIAGRSSLLT